MKITVADHAPGASAGRSAYLESRTQRVLGRMSDRIELMTVELRPDDLQAGHCQVRMEAQMQQGIMLEVSVRRRLMPDALADAFDALVTRIALSGIRLANAEDEFVPATPLPISAAGAPAGSTAARLPR